MTKHMDKFSAANDGLDKPDQQLYREWIGMSILIGLLSAVVTVAASLPVAYFISYGFSKLAVDTNLQYILTLPAQLPYWLAAYSTWWLSAWWPITPHTAVAAAPFIIFAGVTYYKVDDNPYENNPRDSARGRPAMDFDVKKMGLLEGWLMVLGEFNGIKIKGKLLKLKETLAVLCIAPPGTGKTTGVVVPTILETDDITMIVNDVKPEICDMTSGYRSTKSISLRLEWAANDRPEKGLFFPRWNPLSPRSMPGRGPQRDLYIDRLVNIVVEEPKGDADPHWTNKARASLTGFIHFIANKVEAGNYDGIPEQWYGEEPSLPMLLDWVTEALLSASDEIDRLREEDPNAALFADPVRNFLMDAVREARKYQYDSRSVLELTQLANTPDKERGSILSTMDAGLTIFKNSAVRARTSRSDFSFEDTRGMMDPTTGELKPMTIYLVVNQEDAKALSKITGLFVELLTAWLIAHKPGHVDQYDVKTGPYPVLFVLDEFPQMPKLRALLDGPAVGRGQKVSFLMIAQDLGQIQDTYGNEATEILMGTTAVKLIFTLANTKTSERFDAMVGHRQYKDKTWSQQEGASRNFNPFSQNVSYQWKTKNMWAPNDLLNMPFGKQLILYQGWTQRPLLVDTPFFFSHPRYKKLVDPANGGTYPPAPPMPDWMTEQRLLEEGYIEMSMEETVAAE